ncbi:MAG: hypothetical protein BRC58_00660 [Cyanobacteria bacterium QS_8_64_29]|nr:MAG: hypothetical protein BRC58_00660 [Cyanobacteria bacterium QS_8_64_29]
MIDDDPIGRQNFRRAIAVPDERIDLGRAALYLAQEDDPHLDPEATLATLDRMAQALHSRLPPERYPLRVIHTINDYLYGELSFCGNRQDYYNPRNSFLHQVLAHRTGIPISLSLVYLELARRIDFPMVGIGMPGHFLIQPDFEGAGIFVDAFEGGEILFEQDCQAKLQQIYQQPVSLERHWLQPIGNRQFLARMLTNLKAIYLERQDVARTLAAVERIVLLFPEAARERRDRGLLYYQLGDRQAAARDLAYYLQCEPNARDAATIRRLWAELAG